MSSLAKIYDENEKTFYDYNSGARQSTIKRKIVQVALSCALSFIFFDFTSDFVNGIVTVYSILAGFGLNILFYLMGSDSTLQIPQNATPERQLRVEKANTLSKELFHNVSYFILLSVIIALLCLVYYVAFSANKWLLELAHDGYGQMKTLISKFYIESKYIRLSVTYAYNATMLFFITESVYSFFRTVFRVSFFFEQKILLK